MPRKWNGKKPNLSLREEGIDNHLKRLGIDPVDFRRRVAARKPITELRLTYKKADGSLWARPTIQGWIELIVEDQSQDNWVDEQMRQAPED